MSTKVQPPPIRRRFGLIVAGISGISYFLILVLGALDPHLLQQPVGGGHLSVGLVAGIILVIFIVICAGIYTWISAAESERQS